jgi:hypothetical protein
VFEGVGVGTARGDFERQQPLIVGEGPLPFFEFSVEGLAETAGPHFHFVRLQNAAGSQNLRELAKRGYGSAASLRAYL